MKFLSEKNYHRLFYIGIVIKGLYSVAELALGALFIFFDYETLYRAAYFFTGDEISEGLIANALRDFATTPRSFWAFLFISHAIVKIFLTWGLLREKLWAYPLSAAVFALFIASQLYQMNYTPSFALSFVTVFDVVLVVLILHEYRRKRSRHAGGIA